MSETQSQQESDEKPARSRVSHAKESQAEVTKRDADAGKQAERDAADVEVFHAFRRGEALLRGENGSFDPVAYEAAEQARREQAEDEK
jgi:hypothetical protein